MLKSSEENFYIIRRPFLLHMVDDGVLSPETAKALKELRARAKREFSKGNRNHKYYGSDELE